MQIEVKYYNWNGSHKETVIYPDEILAFAALSLSRLDAHAYPVGTTLGCYNWQRDRDHDYCWFLEKLALCCNDPHEYLIGLARLGLLK